MQLESDQEWRVSRGTYIAAATYSLCFKIGKVKFEDLFCNQLHFLRNMFAWRSPES